MKESSDLTVVFWAEVSGGAEAGEATGLFGAAEVGDVICGPRAEVEDVGEVALIAVDPCFLEHLVEEPAGRADEGFADPLFVFAPGFANDCYLGHSRSPVSAQ